MTSRERMKAALEGKEIDQIPVAPYFWAAEYSWKLTRLPLWEILHGDMNTLMITISALDKRHQPDWIIETFNSSRQLKGKTLSKEDNLFLYFIEDETGEEYRFHKEGHWLLKSTEIDGARIDNSGKNSDPPKNKAEADEWLRRNYPRWTDEGRMLTTDISMRNNFPDAYICGSVTPPFAALAYPMGFEPAMIMLHDNPELCAYILEEILFNIDEQCRYAKRQDCDAIMMVDSLASADIMSPDTYKNYVAPFHKLVSDEAHKAGLKSIIYNTGNMMPLLDTLVSLDFDAISVEERIKGVEMDIGEIRETVGPDICLFGNFDSYLLSSGNREKISEEIARQIKSAGPRSFVMGTGSPICDATDPETMDFWFEEIRKYPIG